MIEISHKQARHLLHIEMDRHLPNEQWTSLQAHLENCVECRAYRDRLGGLEKDLRRTLRSGWETVSGPGTDTSQRVLGMFHQRQRQRQRLYSTGMLLAGLVLVFFIGRSIITGDLQKMIPGTSGAAEIPDTSVVAPSTVEPPATPIPTARAGDFPDVVVYEARLDGRADGKKQIYLLNPGSDPVDLFDGSANDSDPVWSPDGQWIAFLSDRTGKEEIFVTSMVSNKVIQLTDSPGVTWEGPLSWSADGQWLTLSGVRDLQGGQRWVYVVGMDGSGARALPGGRGGIAPEFAPIGDRLAFAFTDGPQSGVTIYHLETGEKVTTAWPENPAALAPAPGSALDWSADGSGLVYIASAAIASGATAPAATASAATAAAAAAPSVVTAPTLTASANTAAAPSVIESPPAGDVPSATPAATPIPGASGSQVLIVRDLNASIALSFDFSNGMQVAQSAWPGAYRAVSWTPTGTVLYTEDLGDARANDKPGTTPGGCWTIQARQQGFRGFINNNNSNITNTDTTSGAFASRLWSVNGVCVEGGLDHQSWTPDGRWVVVLGRLPSSQQRALYAIRMPGRGAGFYYRPGRTTPTPSASTGPAAPSATIQARPFDPAQANQPPVGSALRLLDANWVGALPRVRPRLTIFSQPVNINPLPVTKSKPALPPSDLSHRPDGPSGQIVYTVQNSSVSAVVKANPDGTGGQILAATSGINRCPRFSPDGQSIALVAPGGTYAGGQGINDATAPSRSADLGDEVFVMDADGGNARQISGSIHSSDLSGPTQKLVYGCPVWSPQTTHGGPFVAALLNNAQHRYLAVLPSSAPSQENSAPLARLTGLGVPLQGLGPIWSPDGRSLYLVQRPSDGGMPQLLRVSVPDDPLAPLVAAPVRSQEDWTRVLALAIDPSGSEFIALEHANEVNSAGAADQVTLRRIGLTDSGGGNLQGSPLTLSDTPGQAKITSGQVALLFNSRSTVGLLLQGSPSSAPQAAFFRYDLSYGLQRGLARVEDTVYDLAWSPDGRWVVYSTESGLWGLDMASALQGRAAPVWLSPVPVEGLDWR